MSIARALAVALIVAGSAVAEEAGLIFYAPFDGFKVDAAVAKGNPQSSFKESIELRNYPGVKGGALMLKENERCEYDLKGNFCPKQGTLSCWVKPVNWDGNDSLFQHFICIADSKTPSSWYLYKYANNNNLMFLVQGGRDDHRKTACCGTSIETWERDQWHHLAATWDDGAFRLYVDGKPEGKQIVPVGFLPDEVEGVLSVAPVQYWKNQWCSAESRTLVDEIKIFDRVLAEHEVVEMFDEFNPYADAGARRPSFMTSLRPDVAGGRILISLAAIHLDDFWKQALAQGAEMEVTVTGPKGVIEKKTMPFRREASLEAPMAAWDDGEYGVEAVVTREGRVLTGEATLRKPPTPWLTQKPGAEFLTAVLPPYTPLEREGNTVTCWGRAVRFGKGPFPNAMQSQGKALLRAPIALSGKINNCEFEAAGETRITSAAGNRITFEGSQELTGARLAWTGYMEYDGMVRCDFSIAPQGRMDVQSLRMDVPMSPEFIRYIRTPKRWDWTGDGFESPFLSYVWVGDERRGLCWFMESDANFHNPQDAKVLHVSRKTGNASLTAISDPVSTDKTLFYTIGFQATPLKALPKDWRAWRLGDTSIKGCNMMTHGWGPRCYTLSASLVPPEPDKHMEDLKKWHDQGVKIYSYSCCGCAADLLDEWPFCEADWFCAYGSTFPGYKRWPDNAPYSLRSVCVASSYADFLVQRVEDLMRNRWADGLYTDIDHPSGCDNRLHGCGYTDAFGRTGKTYPIFKHRDLSKRLYGICHKYGGLYLSHAHNDFVCPYHAFIDGWCPGEQLSVAVIGKHTFYMDGLKLDDWRGEYYSPTTGVVTFMLAQWGRLSPKEDQKIRFPTENLIAMAALHDVPLWAGFTNTDVVGEFWTIQKEFGFEDVEFCPYWENPPVITPTEDVRISVYKKPGKMLAVVVNFSDQDKDVELHLATTPGRCSVVYPTDAVISGEGVVWRVPVRKKNFALVKIETGGYANHVLNRGRTRGR